MKPDYKASVEFLHRWAPEGPWVLTSIDPNKRGTSTATFGTGKEEERKLLKWLTTHGKTKNVYFTVNPTKTRVTKKPSRKDIAKLAWLHVDVDPRAREDLAEEQARILQLFKEDLPTDIPPPSCVIFSGGGYQGFWRLADPFTIDGKVELFEEAALYNLQIEHAFEDADHCHNVDRIMRLPGTINRPDKRKREKGRVNALARVEWWADDDPYPLEVFTKAVPTQAGETGLTSSHTVEVSGNVQFFESLDELDGVKGYTKAVIAQGCDVENPNKWMSRSDALHYVCCQLVRDGLDDETIYAIITDPGWKISAHVLDQSSPERAAKRNIARAREAVDDPTLMKMNDQFSVISDVGGKCLVVSEVFDFTDPDGLKRARLSYQTFSAFRHRFMNQSVEVPDKDGKPKLVAKADWWLRHPKRSQFDTVVFEPDGLNPAHYNLWKGFHYPAKAGDCELFLAHVRENVCGGNVGHFEYLMGWMATAVQRPAQPGHVAVVLRGKQGTGKSFFAKTFGRLFGRHFLQVSDPKHLVGSFNAHLRDCLVLFGDEAFYAGDKKHESVLKTLVTEEMITIEAKGIDATAQRNYVHLIMASNDDWVVPAGPSERRYFVLDVGDDRKQDGAYFRAIYDQLKSGGYEALLYMLRKWDLSDFNVRAVPRTAALDEQQQMSHAPDQAWWYEKLSSGELIRDGEGWPEEVLREAVLDDYQHHLRVSGRRGASVTPWTFLKKQCLPDGITLGKCRGRKSQGAHSFVSRDGRQVNLNGRPWTVKLPSLSEMREAWDTIHGTKTKWPEVPDEQQRLKIEEVNGQDVPF